MLVACPSPHKYATDSPDSQGIRHFGRMGTMAEQQGSIASQTTVDALMYQNYSPCLLPFFAFFLSFYRLQVIA